MFLVKEHLAFSDACFPREKGQENYDLCFCLDFDSQPAEYGKGLIRYVADGVSSANGKNAVEESFPVLCTELAGKLMGVSRSLSNHALLDDDSSAITQAVYQILLDSLQAANTALRYSAAPDSYCTVSIAVVFHRSLYTANIGDSPIYLMDLTSPSPELQPIFECDNEAGKLIAGGLLTEETALHHPSQSILHRFLGYGTYNLLDDDNIHFRRTELPQSCIVLLGSDGALSQLPRREMADLILDHLDEGFEAVRDCLIRAVGGSGSVDDFTLVMDRIETD